MNWKPIGTAPKNKQVLISDGHEVVYSVWGKVSHVPIYGWLEIVGHDAEDTGIIEDFTPTHWMPLPPAPEEAQ